VLLLLRAYLLAIQQAAASCFLARVADSVFVRAPKKKASSIIREEGLFYLACDYFTDARHHSNYILDVGVHMKL
jgi:hypothetical protein